MAKITVLGAGGWGMALALLSYNNGNSVNIWSPFQEEVNQLNQNRTNERLLKDIYLPGEINITTDINCAENSDITVIAVPSVAIRATAQNLSQVKNTGIIVNVAKGFDEGTLCLLSDVIKQELPNSDIVVLTGPSHAEEVARSMPTSISAVSENIAAAKKVQEMMSGNNMRIYTNDDVVGAELGGALKNVIAICVGFCNGLQFGDNTRAALITRGLAEMTRLGVAMGASADTFSGLTGIGDLVVTCMSRHSRNNRFGTLVGGGMSVKEALETVGTVEGYYAAKNAYQLSIEYGVSMPIISECYNVLYNGKNVHDVVSGLMNRPLARE